MSGVFRFWPLVFLLVPACSFDPSGIDPGGANNTNQSNNTNNTNGNENTNNTTCGNGVVNTGEDCDGSELNGETCVTQGYSGSGLACDGLCAFDVSACDPPLTCGNGTIDGGEDCEDGDLNGESCASLGYYGTGLACDSTCHFDMSVCVANGQCGDNLIQPGPEECDGTDLGGHDCTTLGEGVGPVTCTGTCTFDVSACVPPEVCDDFTDNDSDGFTDCIDTDCAADPWCQNSYSTEFDFTDEEVTIGSLADVTGSAPVMSFTVSFWLKLNGIQDDWATALGVTSGGAWDDGFAFYHTGGDNLRFWINQYDANRVTTLAPVSSGVWYHIVGTYDAGPGADNIKLYLDGVLQNSADFKGAVTLSAQPIGIGVMTGDDIRGWVDEVAFWPIALDAANVLAIYNGGSPFNLLYDQGNYNQSATLSAYYRMGDQDTHPTITDRAGTNNGSVTTGDGNEFVTDVP